jgi:SAM-dependent methyltransferase
MSGPATSPPGNATVIWHDLECGSYTGDLALWDEFAGEGGEPVLDLGCGTGRVSLHLARRGRHVLGIDREPAFVGELNRRALREELPASADVGDAVSLDLGEARFPLAVVPMQLIELIPGQAARVACLRGIAAHLAPGGMAALALVGELMEVADAGPPLPDVHETDGWVYSSLPLPTAFSEGRVEVRRLRQVVSPQGELSEEVSQVPLFPVAPDTVEDEARGCGLRPSDRIEVPPTPDHVGSTVVVLEAG